LKELHSKKQGELKDKEIEVCRSKLAEITAKLEKGKANMNSYLNERTSYLKTQSLICKHYIHCM
jgi:hypothetical protein